MEPLFAYSKQALLEQLHQMFCINQKLSALTSRLRNGRFQEQLAMNSFYIRQILNLKFTKKDIDTQKN